MQLFICDFELKKDNIVIEDEAILYQIRNVLRSKIGYSFFVQKKMDPKYRYEVKILDWDNKKLIWSVVSIIDRSLFDGFKWMIIAMPNKRDKVEMIVQKLSELSISEIIFWPSDRSIIKSFNNKKYDRLNKISKEAVEQSWWWILPEIRFVDQLKGIIWNKKLIVFDKEESQIKQLNKTDLVSIYWLVGPEWWLTDKDYQSFGENFEIRQLGNTVLRTETAAIVWAWNIINDKL